MMKSVKHYETELRIQKANLSFFTEFGYTEDLEPLVKYFESNIKELESIIEKLKNKVIESGITF